MFYKGLFGGLIMIKTYDNCEVCLHLADAIFNILLWHSFWILYLYSEQKINVFYILYIKRLQILEIVTGKAGS